MNFAFLKQVDIIGSVLVRWGLEEPVGHVALVLSDDQAEESTSQGVHLSSWKYLQERENVVSLLEPNWALDPEKENEVRKRFNEKCPIGSMYDYLAFIYFAWRCILKKLLDKPFPKSNLLAEGGVFLCVEAAWAAAESYEEVYGLQLLDHSFDSAMVSPWSLRRMLLESGQFKEKNA